MYAFEELKFVPKIYDSKGFISYFQRDKFHGGGVYVAG